MRIDDGAKRELASFAIGLGGALGVAGSILPWAVVTFRPGPIGVGPAGIFTRTRHVLGTHTADGKITLGIALAVALLGIAGLLMRAGGLRRVAVVVSAVCAVALLGIGIAELFRISGPSALSSPLGYPVPFRGIPFRDFVHVSRGWGLGVVVAGGAIALAASVVDLARARSV